MLMLIAFFVLLGWISGYRMVWHPQGPETYLISLLSTLLGRKTVKCDRTEEKQYISIPVIAAAKVPYNKL